VVLDVDCLYDRSGSRLGWLDDDVVVAVGVGGGSHGCGAEAEAKGLRKVLPESDTM